MNSEQIKNNESIENVGAFLWFSTAVIILQAWFTDPWLIIDALVVGIMAYYAYSKGSKKALYFGTAYYVLGTLLLIPESTSVGIGIRLAISFWMCSVCWETIKFSRSSDYALKENT